jgi:5-enolpyruvylshikimate-3-phosphate synthase
VTINTPLSTQFVSALLLIGANVQTDSTSPYITLTRALIEQYISCRSQGVDCERNVVENNVVGVVDLDNLERDWSSAAFWYEYVALHGGEITLPGLSRDSLQGDKIVADIFAYLGVHTEYTEEGITITKNEDEEFLIQQYEQQKSTTQTTESNNSSAGEQHTPAARKNASLSARCVVARAMLLTKNVVNVVDNNTLIIDFSACPDLYPTVALTCERLGITLHATGVESLPLKESDRLRAVAEHRTDADHRMAMALLIAGYEVDDTACISKSYPQFLEHFHQLQESNCSNL